MWRCREIMCLLSVLSVAGCGECSPSANQELELPSLRNIAPMVQKLAVT